MLAVIDGIIELNKSWMLQSSHNFDFSFHGSSVLLFCGVHHLSGEHQAAYFLLTSINGAKFSSVNRNDLVFTRLCTVKFRTEPYSIISSCFSLLTINLSTQSTVIRLISGWMKFRLVKISEIKIKWNKMREIFVSLEKVVNCLGKYLHKIFQTYGLYSLIGDSSGFY